MLPSSLPPLLGSSRRRHTISVAALLLAVLLSLVSGSVADARVGGRDGWVPDSIEPLGPGVAFTAEHRDGPVSSMTVEVEPGAPVRFLPVLSGDRIDGGRETVSSMCHRANALACVNANFPVCPSCDDPFGGVVKDGVLMRSPDPIQDQVSIIDGRFTSVPFTWSAGLQAVIPGGPSVEADAVNTGIVPDGVVLYSPDFGDRTPAPAGSYELVFRAPEPLRTGSNVRQQAALLYVHDGGNAPIPDDGYVMTGVGRGADELWAFVERFDRSLIELYSNTPNGLSQSFSGHPVLIRNGSRVNLDPGDPKVVNRHPRTLVGWNDAGKVWLVVVDGRQQHSRGMDLAEASEHLLALGATEGVNLDGGGSSTMVTSCGSGHWCARNRPSDGQERRVWVGLAVVGSSAATTVAPAVPEPAPPTIPPTIVPEPAAAAPADDPIVAATASGTPTADIAAAASPAAASLAGDRVVVALPLEAMPQTASLDQVELAFGFVETPPASTPARSLPPLAVALAGVAVAVEAAMLRRLVAVRGVPAWIGSAASPAVSDARSGLPSTLGTARASFRSALRRWPIHRGRAGG